MSVRRLCEIGYVSNVRFRNGSLAGVNVTCSEPSRRKTGHRRSASVGAATRVPSDVRGATRLAAKATA